MDNQGQPCNSDPVRLGKITMIVAAASVVVLLMLSDGYDPRLDFTANLYYLLTLYHGQWFCHKATAAEFLHGSNAGIQCTDIVIRTKYLILFCFLVATYGFLMFKQLAPNPAPHVRAWVNRAWNAVKKMHASITQDINEAKKNRPDGY